MSNEPPVPEPFPPSGPGTPSAGERAAAVEQALTEIEAALRQVSADLLATSRAATPDLARRAIIDTERAVRVVSAQTARLSAAAVPQPVREAQREAERALRETIILLRRAADTGTPEAVRAAGHEAERAVQLAAGLGALAASGLRPGLVRGFVQIDRMLDAGQRQLFRVLWVTVPPGSILRNVRFEALLASRLLSDIALQALLYGVLISRAAGGGGALEAALIGVAALLPGVLFGLQGGAVADALPKRVALAGAYVLMGLICLILPLVPAPQLVTLLAVLLAVRTLHQVAQPSEASAVPLAASVEELASANSALSLAASIGEVVGKALIAPVLVRAFGVDAVITAAGVLFLLSSTRVFDLHFDGETAPLRARQGSTAHALRLLLADPAAPWMLLLAALASTIGVVLGVLGPEYTTAVLGVDPAYALYVFMPAALGLVIGLALAPRLIRRFGERRVAAGGFVSVAIAMTGLGLVQPLTDHLGWILVYELPGVGRPVEMAALLSVPLGLGTTLAAAATQTYIGRAVPPAIHGRTFALLGVLKDGLAIPPLLSIGALASVVGVEVVVAVAPLALLAIALLVDWLAGRWQRGFMPPTAADEPAAPLS